MVRLAEGLDDDNHLDADSLRACPRLSGRFGQRLRGLVPENIRVVGTNTLRRARNSPDFLRKAEKILGATGRNHLRS